MTKEMGAERALDLLGALGDIMTGIGEAVKEGDFGRLEALIPVEEALLGEMTSLCLPKGMAPDVARRIEARAAQVFKKNTENAVLISEQLGLIQATVKVLLGEGPHIDRLA